MKFRIPNSGGMGQDIEFRNSKNTRTLALPVRQSLPPRRDKLFENLQADVLQPLASCAENK